MISCGGHREREGVGRADVRGHRAATGLVGCEHGLRAEIDAFDIALLV